MRGLFFFSAVLLMVTGCQPNPETAHVEVNPQTAPARTITSFNEALRCMDDLYLARGTKDIYITSAGVPDATGQIAAGTKEMLITAISEMSAKSAAFRFVDYDPTQLDVQVLSEMVGLRQDFVAPSYYIRGAITQLDSNVLSSSNSAAISTSFVNLGISKDQVVSVISVDLNLGKLVTRQIIGGMSSSNSITVVRSGKGADVGGVVGKGTGTTGISFSVALDKSEGFHQAVRNLIELSAIEVLGKLTRAPYWQCLKIDSTNPAYRTEARGWFDTMSEADRTKFVQTNLARAGYSGDLRESIARYQAEHDIVSNGRIDFDLYYRLLGGAQPGSPPVANVAPVPTDAALPTPAQDVEKTPPGPTIQLRAGAKSYRVHDSLVVEARTSQDGFVYCYYQDAEGVVSRIFPNRFQPNAFVRAGSAVVIPPGTDKPFSIQFDKARSREEVACIVSSTELGIKLPDALKIQDLEALPVHNLTDIIDSFRRLNAPISEGLLPIEVM